MASYLDGAAAGEQHNGGAVGCETVARKEFRPRGSGTNHGGQRMPYIGCVDAALAKPRLFKREQAEEFLDQLAEDGHPAGTPRPDLWRHQVVNGHAAAFEMAREAQVEIGIVGEECGLGRMLGGEAEQLAVFAVNTW